MSLLGASVTYYLGYRIGEAELERFISEKKAKRVIAKVQKKGAIALAALDLIPPPFPFTAFALTAGALEINAVRFFIAMFCFRLLRFGTEAALAAKFGTSVIRLVESDTARVIAEIFTVIILVGSAVSVYAFIRHARLKRPGPQGKAA
jgi:membrane protein DedA with SNARE-associated domain